MKHGKSHMETGVVMYTIIVVMIMKRNVLESVAIGGWSVGNVPFYQICVCEHCLEGGTVRDKPHKIGTIPLEIITPKIPHYKEDIFLSPEQRRS